MVDLLHIAEEAVKWLSPQRGTIHRVKEGLKVELPHLTFILASDRLEITSSRLPRENLEKIVAWLARHLRFERVALPETGAISSPVLVAAAPDLVARLRTEEKSAGIGSEADHEEQMVEDAPEVDDDDYGCDGPGM